MSYMGLDEIKKNDFTQLENLVEEVKSREEVWLFGGGVYGKAFCKFLKSMHVEITGFVESRTEKKEIEHMPVIDIRTLKARYKPGKTLVLLTLSSRYYAEVYPKLMTLKDDIRFVPTLWLECAVDRCGERGEISLLVPVADYCEGIACFGCTVAAPIANRTSYSYSSFKKDISKLKTLIGDEIHHINFSGGDIFLNPDFVNMVEYTRYLFPKADIDASTNGILFGKQKPETWERLGKCNITLNWTLYPIDYDNMEFVVDKMMECGIKLNIIGDSGGESKNSWRIPYSKERQVESDWLFCKFHKDNNNVLTLWHGELGVCFSIRRVKWMIEKYGDSVFSHLDLNKMRREISLHVDKLENKDEIYNFMTTRMEICNYCNIRGRCSMGAWMQSTGELTEWLV